MRNIHLYTIFLLILSSCGTSKKINNENVTLRYLDDYVIPSNLEIGGTKVGGLSGIEYYNGKYFLVCDHPGNPRYYIATIDINGRNINTVNISEVVELERSAEFLNGKHLDLEGIRVDKGLIVLSSEGSIQNQKEPSIFQVTTEGDYESHFTLPNYFLPSEEQKPRNNGVFEGLAKSFDQTGFWVGMELPLVKDGSKPKLFPTKSPVRITRFNKESGEATRQFVINLEHITKIPWLYFAVNGLTELLEYAPDRFLVLERAFSAGHGTNGNTVRIFDVDASMATNTLQEINLRKTNFRTADKKLIFDFKPIRKTLKQQIIDNIEGMTFGPDLPNGNKTLLLISDDNFSSLGKQITQIILLEMEVKDHINVKP